MPEALGVCLLLPLAGVGVGVVVVELVLCPTF